MTPRWMPEWIGPAAYLAGVAVLGLIFVAGLQLLSGRDGSAGVKASQLAKVAVSQKPRRKSHDTPESAPELSPLYPTPHYPVSEAGSQAEAARKHVRETRQRSVKERRPRRDRGGDAFALGYQPETTGLNRW